MKARRGGVTVLLATLLVAGGCTDNPAPEPETVAPVAETQERPALPTPAERLGLVSGWGPSVEDLDRAARLVRRLPLPDLAGQVIVAEWAGTRAPTRMVKRLHLGGVIAFADNVVSTGQIRAVNRTLSRSTLRDWPLFLAVDQEGGIVERVRGNATRFPTFLSAGAARRLDLTRAAACQWGGAARTRLHRRLRPGRRRDHRTRRPDHRLPLGGLRSGCCRRARDRGREGFRLGRDRPGAQALPRSRLGAH